METGTDIYLKILVDIHNSHGTSPAWSTLCLISFYFSAQVTYQRLIAAYCQNGDIEGARWENLLFCSWTNQQLCSDRKIWHLLLDRWLRNSFFVQSWLSVGFIGCLISFPTPDAHSSNVYCWSFLTETFFFFQHHIRFHEEQRFTHHWGCFQLAGDRPCSCRVSATAIVLTACCI